MGNAKQGTSIATYLHDHIDEGTDNSPAIVQVEVHLRGEFAGLVAQHAEYKVVGGRFGVGT